MQVDCRSGLQLLKIYVMSSTNSIGGLTSQHHERDTGWNAEDRAASSKFFIRHGGAAIAELGIMVLALN